MEEVNGFAIATYLSNICLSIDQFSNKCRRYQKAILIPKELEARLFTSNEEEKLRVNYSKEGEEEEKLKSIHELKNVQKIALKWKIEVEIEGNLGAIMRIAEDIVVDFARNEGINLKKLKVTCGVNSKGLNFEILSQNKFFYLVAKDISTNIANCEGLISHFEYEMEYELDIQGDLKRYEKTINSLVEELSILNEEMEIQKQFCNKAENLSVMLTSSKPLNALSTEYLLDELKESYGEIEFSKNDNTITFALPWMAIIS